MKNRKKIFGWILAAVLLALAGFTRFCLVGYSFSALIFLGMSAVCVLYQLFPLLAKKKPVLARRLRRITTFLLCLAVIAAAVTGLLIYGESKGKPDTDCQYIIVLGAGVNGTVPSLSLRERLNAAYDYLAAHPDAVAVVSGCQGDGEDISEAQCMYNELTRMGIPPERVWMEDQAENTRENLRFSLDIIEARTGQRPDTVGIVSSEYHLYRAGFFARECELNPVGIPAKTSWITLRVNYYLREIAAVWYYCILGG